MAKNLTWFQAKDLALAGSRIRRIGWEFWIVGESLEIWRREDEDNVVLNQEFGVEDFIATDWTDEPWQGAEDDAATGGDDDPDSGGGGTGGESKGEDDASEEMQRLLAATTGGGKVGSGAESGPTFNFSGSFNAPGGGGGGGGGGGRGGRRARRRTVPETPEVQCSIGFPDAALCYVTVGATVSVFVSVRIVGGPAGLGSLSVDVNGGTPQLAMGYDGFNQSFMFDGVAYNPSGGVTVTADYSPPGGIADVVGTATAPFPPSCPDNLDTVTELSYSCTAGVITLDLEYTVTGATGSPFTKEWTWTVETDFDSIFAGCPDSHSGPVLESGRWYMYFEFTGEGTMRVDVTDYTSNPP